MLVPIARSIPARIRSRTCCAFSFLCAGLIGLSGCTPMPGRPAHPASLPPMPADVLPASSPLAEPAVPAVARRLPAPVTPSPRPARAPRESRPAPAAVAALDPGRLIGLDPSEVRTLLGAPARIHDDKLAREWIYAAPGCSFRVFFYPNLNAAKLHVLKYSSTDESGARLAPSHACVRRILTGRNDATE